MFKLLLAGILCASSFISMSEAQCQRTYTRREFRKLSESERTNFFNAVKKLNQGNKPSEYDKITLQHLANSQYAHGHTGFLVWHRQYLLRFEEALQKIDPSVSVPYWDWSYDSQAPDKAGLLTKNYFGSNGNPRKNNCVEDGVFANWEVLYDGGANERKHCLRREYDEEGGKISAFYAPEAIKAIIDKSKTYADLTSTIENAPHGGPHVGIGGDMTTHASPNDPLFWLHHAFVDKIFYDWQLSHPQEASNYQGRNYNGRAATKNDILQPFTKPVGDYMDINKLCYKYSADEVPVQPLPPITITSVTTSATASGSQLPSASASKSILPSASASGSAIPSASASGSASPSASASRSLSGSQIPSASGSASGSAAPGSSKASQSASGVPSASQSYPSPPIATQTTVVNLNITVPENGKQPEGPKIPIDAPNSKDREDPYKIRVPKPLPAAWCNMNKLNIELVKKQEDKLAQVISVFNQVNYISPASLCKRPDLASNLNATIPVIAKPVLPVLPNAQPSYTPPTTLEAAPSPTKKAEFSVTVDANKPSKTAELIFCSKQGKETQTKSVPAPTPSNHSGNDYSSKVPVPTGQPSYEHGQYYPKPSKIPSRPPHKHRKKKKQQRPHYNRYDEHNNKYNDYNDKYNDHNDKYNDNNDYNNFYDIKPRKVNAYQKSTTSCTSKPTPAQAYY